MQFAEKYIPMGQDFARKILFTDEKKFCLFDSRHGKWILTRGDESYNIARYLDMTDEEYREWVQEHRGERLPRAKQRGLYPCFVWGGVGYNKKSKLYFLEAGETLTADRYRCILQENLLPVRKQYPRSWYGTRGTMHITMDNDPKHYNKDTREFLCHNNIKLVGCHRHDVDGNPDLVPGPGGALQEHLFDDKFVAYRCDFTDFHVAFM